MYILSVDTTAKTASAAVSKVSDGEVFPLCDARLNSTLTHSESILPMIEFCLKNASVHLSEIDVLAISACPGSFTGVRIGISTVKGLAFGSDNVKCVPVSALEALCENVSDEAKGTVICACMDARRNQFYNALFSANGKGSIKRLCEDRAVGEDELYAELCEKYSGRKIVLVGDGALLALRLFSAHDGFENMKISTVRSDRLLQDASSVARCAIRHIDGAVPADKLSPVYLRLSQAERERNERMTKE
ncbi:MAG: tRNA (adenosine(37)-N6)-threonylcarbamoyltransferase complex dimerization subunit type 1 TsaB [Clostridia bacterium]|nr:tRNA (adenosine(37)-N6)-threonylcarbamoyltransferase complex dimerization subunit type 1 TsaB [Clostridia bacterium]